MVFTVLHVLDFTCVSFGHHRLFLSECGGIINLLKGRSYLSRSGCVPTIRG